MLAINDQFEYHTMDNINNFCSNFSMGVYENFFLYGKNIF